jgi:hypothetical protein
LRAVLSVVVRLEDAIVLDLGSGEGLHEVGDALLGSLADGDLEGMVENATTTGRGPAAGIAHNNSLLSHLRSPSSRGYA